MLRWFSGNAFLQGECVKYKLGVWVDEAKTKFEWSLAPLKYATTIHAINSCVVKISGLTVASVVHRGVAGKSMPTSFFKKNSMNIAGGVEYGFSSTTNSREQAAVYAKVGDASAASTLLEAQVRATALVSPCRLPSLWVCVRA